MRGRMKRPKPPLGSWVILTDGLLLFLALVSTVFGVVTAYHVEAVESLLWVGAVVLTLVILLLVNLPRYRWTAILAAAALWGWGLWKLWEPLTWGGTRLHCDLVNTVAAKLPDVGYIVPIKDLPSPVWLQATTLWLLMIGAAFALGLGLLLCRVRLALPVILWTLLPILPALCVTEAPALLPMAGLLAVWFTLLLTSLVGRRDPTGAARLRAAAAPLVVAALALLAQVVPTQGTVQPVWAADLRQTFRNGVERMDLSALLTRLGGWTGSGSTQYMNLTGGAPNRTGRMALRIRNTKPGKFYLRGWSADVYTGRRWEPLSKSARRELEAIRETGIEPLLMLGESWEAIYGSTTTMTVENIAAPGGCVYYPYALAVLPEGAAFGGDSHLEREGGVWEHTVTFRDYSRNTAYLSGFYWEGSLTSAGRYRDSTDGLYRDFVYDHELQVPDDLRPILEDWLAEATEDWLGYPVSSLEEYVRYGKAYVERQRRRWEQLSFSSLHYDSEILYGSAADYPIGVNDYESLSPIPTQEEIDAVTVTPQELEQYRDEYSSVLTDAVVRHMAKTTRYDRNTPAPPAGRDYVDWFLNESKQGYCMHYATAATLLLRTAGIPARYTSGYLASVSHSGGADVTDHAAHAWVEVYQDEVGWYPREVTPGFESNAMGDIPALESGEAAAVPTPTPTPVPTAEPTPSAAAATETPAPTPSRAPGAPGASGGGGKTALPLWSRYVLAALLGLAAVLSGRWMLQKRRRERLESPDKNAAVLCLYTLHRRLKPWGGTESGELTRLAEKARFSQHHLTDAERDRAAEILDRETRRVYEALPGWKKPFFTLICGKA